MDLIERVGAYAGVAAFLGLAILALLYFSQARDVRRLREWAGRAPERGREVAAAAAQHELPPTPIDEVSRRRRPLRQRIRNIHIPRLRYLAIAVGALVILAGATLGALELVGGDDQGATESSAKRGDGKRVKKKRASRPSPAADVDPASVTVAVLNGTTIAGLAAQVSDEARVNGFTLGTVTNAAQTDRARSEVLYRKGQREKARAVADRLDIDTTAPVDSISAEIAGSADVVVLVGSDRSG